VTLLQAWEQERAEWERYAQEWEQNFDALNEDFEVLRQERDSLVQQLQELIQSNEEKEVGLSFRSLCAWFSNSPILPLKTSIKALQSQLEEQKLINESEKATSNDLLNTIQTFGPPLLLVDRSVTSHFLCPFLCI